jgi:putative protease
VRSEADKKESASLKSFENITRKIPIEFDAKIKCGVPASLTAKSGERIVTVLGDIPETARTQPISEETLRRNLSKLGDTVYTLRALNIELDDGLMMPISAINALRRAAVDKLKVVSERSENDICLANKSFPSKKRVKVRSAVFYQPENIPDRAKDFFNYIYIPLEKYSAFSHTGYGVMLPEVIFDSERESVEEMLKSAYENGARDALIGNIGHIEIAKKYRFALHGDMRLNVFNNSSAAYFEELGVEDVVLSPELTLRQMRDIGGLSSVCVYGRLPLMITEKCVGREIGSCKECENGSAKLIDRRGFEFPVLKRYPHRSAIFNSLPTYMADKREELRNSNAVAEFFIFTVENSKQIEDVIYNFENEITLGSACRRIK